MGNAAKTVGLNWSDCPPVPPPTVSGDILVVMVWGGGCVFLHRPPCTGQPHGRILCLHRSSKGEG